VAAVVGFVKENGIQDVERWGAAGQLVERRVPVRAGGGWRSDCEATRAYIAWNLKS